VARVSERGTDAATLGEAGLEGTRDTAPAAGPGPELARRGALAAVAAGAPGLNRAAIAQLQRSAGNAAVSRLIAGRRAPQHAGEEEAREPEAEEEKRAEPEAEADRHAEEAAHAGEPEEEEAREPEAEEKRAEPEAEAEGHAEPEEEEKRAEPEAEAEEHAESEEEEKRAEPEAVGSRARGKGGRRGRGRRKRFGFAEDARPR
jgi:colicin import membrane protein